MSRTVNPNTTVLLLVHFAFSGSWFMELGAAAPLSGLLTSSHTSSTGGIILPTHAIPSAAPNTWSKNTPKAMSARRATEIRSSTVSATAYGEVRPLQVGKRRSGQISRMSGHDGDMGAWGGWILCTGDDRRVGVERKGTKQNGVRRRQVTFLAAPSALGSSGFVFFVAKGRVVQSSVHSGKMEFHQ
jgi:hypothetical protein